MPLLKVTMLGEFCTEFEGVLRKWSENCKTRELFCYLVIHPASRHRRERLADLLWGNSPMATAKKNLRQALWQLQSRFGLQQKGPSHLFSTDSEWLSLHPELEVWTDVRAFLQACECLRDPSELDAPRAQALQRAVELYQGDLLEGCYQDWCLYERERLQNLFLTILDRLIGYYEKHQQYEDGISYGEWILKYDIAGERAHQQLMRLRYLAGDRTGALRQYEQCVKALRDELGVQPGHHTRELYEQIRSDQISWPVSSTAPSPSGAPSDDEARQLSPADFLPQLRSLQRNLADLQQQAQQLIQIAERLGSGQRDN